MGVLTLQNKLSINVALSWASLVGSVIFGKKAMGHQQIKEFTARFIYINFKKIEVVISGQVNIQI